MLVKSDLQSAQLENKSSTPSVSKKGKIYFSTLSKDILIDTGTVVRPVGIQEYDYICPIGDAVALRAALEGSSYKSIFIPSAVYDFGSTTQIIVNSNVKYIIGAYADKYATSTRDGVVLKTSNATTTFIRVNSDGCIIKNLTFYNSNTSNNAKCLEVTNSGYHIFIKSCRFEGFVNTSLYGNDDNPVGPAYSYTIKGEDIFIRTSGTHATNVLYAMRFCGDMKNILIDFSSWIGRAKAIRDCKNLSNVQIFLGTTGDYTGIANGLIAIQASYNINNIFISKTGTENGTVNSNFICGVLSCFHVNNVAVFFNFTSNGANNIIRGFSGAQKLSSCYCNTASITAGNSVDCFFQCYTVSASRAICSCVTNSAVFEGFDNCYNISGNYVTMTAGNQVAYDVCKYCSGNSYSGGTVIANTTCDGNTFPDSP